MATYNGARFLPEQLESILAQTYSPYELVVTDDGSTDATAEIIEQFSRRAPFPVRFYRNPERLRFAENFLHCASLCDGDLISFCDQDDVWLPDKLETAVIVFQDPEVMAFTHSAQVVDEHLNKLGWLRPYYPNEGQARWQPWGTFLGFAIVCRRKLISIPFDERPPSVHGSPKLAHDEWIIFLAEGLGKIYFCKRSLAFYRQHGMNQYGAGQDESAKKSIAIGISVGAELYTRLRDLAHKRQVFINRLAENESLADEDRKKLQRYAHRYGEAGLTLENRSALHQPSARFLQRIRIFLRMCANGDYGRSGMLWRKALLKDFAITVLGRRLKLLRRFMLALVD